MDQLIAALIGWLGLQPLQHQIITDLLLQVQISQAASKNRLSSASGNNHQMAPHETSTNEATGDHSRVATSADPHGAEYQKYSRVSPSRNQNIG